MHTVVQDKDDESIATNDDIAIYAPMHQRYLFIAEVNGVVWPRISNSTDMSSIRELSCLAT